MLLPPKNRGKSSRSNAATRVPTVSADCTGLWSLSFGLAAISVAAIVFFVGHDHVGAAFIMLAASAIVAVMINASVIVEE